MKKILLALAVLGFVFAGMNIVGVNNANAYCYSGAGKIVYMYTNSSGTTPYAYVYLSTGMTFPIYYRYYRVNDQLLISELNSAAAAHSTVQVRSGLSSCPTVSGTTIYGGVATVVYIYNSR